MKHHHHRHLIQEHDRKIKCDPKTRSLDRLCSEYYYKWTSNTLITVFSWWWICCTPSLVEAKRSKVIDITPTEYYTIIVVIIILVLIGGIVAGLTIGLLSLDSINLAILQKSGTPRQKRFAERIAPIRKNTHLLLVTLLLTNVVVNETLPVLFHEIQWDGWQAVLISSALIVVFGEIIPQAVCARYGLEIGAFFAWPVRILMWCLFVIAWPIAKLLDAVLGHSSGVMYRRAELKELVALHGEEHHGSLSRDEVGILRAVLELRDKTVKHVMTPLDVVFMINYDGDLDPSTVSSILQSGHSRVPVYKDDRTNIIGVVLVKQLILRDPQTVTPISMLKLRRLPHVSWETPLFEILHIFEEGGSHMAVVIQDQGDGHLIAIGIVTLEDVIEELLGEEIVDETDIYVDMATRVKVARALNLGAQSGTENPPLNLSSGYGIFVKDGVTLQQEQSVGIIESGDDMNVKSGRWSSGIGGKQGAQRSYRSTFKNSMANNLSDELADESTPLLVFPPGTSARQLSNVSDDSFFSPSRRQGSCSKPDKVLVPAELLANSISRPKPWRLMGSGGSGFITPGGSGNGGVKKRKRDGLNISFRRDPALGFSVRIDDDNLDADGINEEHDGGFDPSVVTEKGGSSSVVVTSVLSSSVSSSSSFTSAESLVSPALALPSVSDVPFFSHHASKHEGGGGEP